MKIACLQFDSRLGAVQKNIDKANSLLEGRQKGDFELLVLPELAFSGYNFPSLAAIVDYLETPGQGPSSEWAKRTAKAFDCVVAVGYPEKDIAISSPATPLKAFEGIIPEYSQAEYNYNSLVVYSPAGHLIANYRKSFLYYTEATWAREGEGFSVTSFDGLPLHDTLKHDTLDSEDSLVKEQYRVSFGICMDINPKNFDPLNSDKYEFASHVVNSSVDLVILSMAWLSFALTPSDVIGSAGKTPELDTWSYWFQRFLPVLQKTAGKDVTFVMANRCGIDRGAHSKHGNMCNTWDHKVVEFVEAVRAGLQFSSPEQWVSFNSTLAAFRSDEISYSAMREEILQALSGTEQRRTKLIQLFESLLTPDSSFVNSESSALSHASLLNKSVENAKLMAQVSAIIESTHGVIVPDIVYAGSSMVWTAKDGQITVHGHLGKGEEGCLIVDTHVKSREKLLLRLKQEPVNEDALSDEFETSLS